MIGRSPIAHAVATVALAEDDVLPTDAARLAKIAALALALTPLLDVQQTLEASRPHLAGLLPGACGYLAIWRDAARGPQHQAPFGAPLPALLPPETAVGSGLCAMALADGAMHVLLDAPGGRQALAPWEWAVAAGCGQRSMLAAPLAAGDDLRAVLLLCAAVEPCADDLLLVASVCAAIGGTLVRAGSHGAAQNEKLAGMRRLTAAIAHEVNNPLQAVSNSLHLLLSRSLSEDKRERYLVMAQKEVEQMIDVVRRMLDFSRPERDGRRPVAVHAALERVLAAAAVQLREGGITVEREWFEHLPRVSGVATHLKQAFLNLVLASLESMPSGGTLTVRTGVIAGRDGRGELVVIDFADTGPRLPEEELRTIFEPFHHARRQGGGMGLPLSYSIIAEHGGRLTVRSEDGGTTFRVELPALQG